ncbi:hypothetical protein Cenrod_2245 [Candidatus Symbiobacter mobilis CR]|uniref:Uncharacterized protein n=1 Tax=Candidatus Symbiobacter mobilis CR TaxID=946483 RepID=U5NAG4_9BURK|nr:hypothetical protein Cenrod_2245 [Candidatus Symbiobacter mobilis CR]
MFWYGAAKVLAMGRVHNHLAAMPRLYRQQCKLHSHAGAWERATKESAWLRGIGRFATSGAMFGLEGTGF